LRFVFEFVQNEQFKIWSEWTVADQFQIRLACLDSSGASGSNERRVV